MRGTCEVPGKKKKKKKEKRKKGKRERERERERERRSRGNYRKRGTRLTLPVLLETQRGPRRGETPSCPFFFLPAGSRDDGVCPRGRSILREPWIACESAAGEDRRRKRERERERGGEGREGKAGGGNDRKRARVGSLSRSPWGPARNAHLKRGRNGRGAPGVFLTRIPNVRTCRPPSHPSAPYRSPVAATPAPLVLSPLPFGLSILSWTFFFASSSSLSACLFSALVLARDKNFRWAVSALTCGRSREYGLSGKTEGGGGEEEKEGTRNSDEIRDHAAEPWIRRLIIRITYESRALFTGIPRRE